MFEAIAGMGYAAPRPADPVPDGARALHEAVLADRRRTEEWAAAEHARIKSLCEARLSRIDRAVDALGRPTVKAAGAAKERTRSTARSRRRSKRRRPMSTSPSAVAERRKSVHRFLLESEKPLPIGEIRRSLGLSEHAAYTALRTLVNEGLVERVGAGAGSRYRATQVRATQLATRAQAAEREVDDAARQILLSVVKERGYASLDELRQATGLANDEILLVCGALVREGVLQMERRKGRGVYVLRRRG